MGDSIPGITVTLTLPNDPRLFVSGHKRCMKEGNVASMHYHHRRHIPWHFQGFAGAKYGYQPRSRGYIKRKIKAVGHTLPNVYTGASRTSATTSHNVTPTQRGARLTFQLAIKSGRSGRVLDAAAAARLFAAGKRKTAGFTDSQIEGQKKIRMRIAEMQTIAVDELKAINEELARVYVAEADKPTTKKRVRIKTK